MGKKALLLLSGSRPAEFDTGADIVICADSGYVAALDSGIEVDHLVGDMDSIPPEYLLKAEELGVKVLSYPADKDLADGEIALRLALDLGCDEIRIAGGKHGRLDHIISTGLLPLLVPGNVNIEVFIGRDRLYLLRAGSELRTGASGIVSIIPIGDDAVVSTKGLKWPLDGETLLPGSTKGIHNEPISETFQIRCEKGRVWVILMDEG
ncbi:MAG: thiamine diphosphokinase [Thermoplasmatota archaeon]